MDAPQWSQTLARPMEELENTTPPNNNNNSTNSIAQQQEASLERRTRPQKDQNINCPRCNSTNTKFCYYNNYSLTQPRFFCKTCRRYWTQGGSLRSVPVGGGSRKNKRSSYSTSSTPPPQPPLPRPLSTQQNPNIKFLEGQDLNLAFPIQGLLFNHNNNNIEGNNIKKQNYGLPINMNNDDNNNNNITRTATTTATNSSPLSALELLRSGIASRGILNPFVPMTMPDSHTLYQSGSYPNMPEFKPSINFCTSTNHEVDDNNNNNEARLLFPFADMNKLATNNHDDDQSKGGYWSGMLGGGPW